MEDNKHNYRISPAIGIAIILQLVFIVFAAFTIHSFLNQNTEVPKIKIDNYSNIPAGKIIGNDSTSESQDIDFALKDSDKTRIENAVYDVVSINNSVNIENNGAKIRDNSAHYVYIEDLNAYLLNFIVDIEDLKQSYRFAWLWGGNLSDKKTPEATFMMAFCVKEDEMIYGNFNCRDNYAGRGLDIAAYNLIKHHSFANFFITLSDVYKGDPLTITIQLPPDENSLEEAAVQELSNYLSELGFSLDDFKYEVVNSKPFTIYR